MYAIVKFLIPENVAPHLEVGRFAELKIMFLKGLVFQYHGVVPSEIVLLVSVEILLFATKKLRLNLLMTTVTI